MSHGNLDFKSAEVLWLMMDFEERYILSQKVFHTYPITTSNWSCSLCKKRATKAWSEVDLSSKISIAQVFMEEVKC